MRNFIIILFSEKYIIRYILISSVAKLILIIRLQIYLYGQFMHMHIFIKNR